MIIKRNLLRLSLFAITLSIVCGLFNPLISFAVPIDESPTDSSLIPADADYEGRATQWVQYRALSACLIKSDYNTYNQIELDALTNGEIFNKSFKPAIGLYFLDVGNETYKCDSVGWVKNAFKNLGFDDMNEAAVAIGLSKIKQSDGTKKWGVPAASAAAYSGSYLIEKFRNAVFARVGDPESRFSAAIQYYHELRAFSAGCLEKNNLSYFETDALTGDALDSVPDNERYNLKWVDDNNAMQSGIYRGVKHGTNIWYRVNISGDSANNGEAECKNDGGFLGSLNDSVNDRVDEFIAYIKETGSSEAVLHVGDTTGRGALITSTTTCAIEGGLGWILCPVLKSLAGIADGVFTKLSDDYLEIKTAMVSSEVDSSTYQAWSAMRNIANVLFVIFFLIIIFSQLTGFGIDNYGIKKLLPKIVIAAILVNLSFFICQIAVDVSNIVGGGLKDLITGFSPITDAGVGGGFSFAAKVGGVLTGIVAGVALGAMLWAAIGTIIPVLLSAVVALVMILFILIARQAIIVLLVVLSPLAFVAFLLPNTEKWFKKWKDTFVSMLLLYPIVALVFGASNLASNILQGLAGGDIVLEIIYSSVMVLPLFIVPSLLKKSLDGVGNIGNVLNNAAKSVGSMGGSKWQNSNLNKYMGENKAKANTAIRAGAYRGMNPVSIARSWTNKGINQLGKESKLLDGKEIFGKPLGFEYLKKRAGGADKLMQIEAAEKAQTLGASIKAVDPIAHYNTKYDDYIKQTAKGSGASAKEQREATIDWLAAKSHLTSTMGYEGVKHIQARNSETSPTAAPPTITGENGQPFVDSRGRTIPPSEPHDTTPPTPPTA